MLRALKTSHAADRLTAGSAYVDTDDLVVVDRTGTGIHSDAFTGEHNRHRLSRAGHRRMIHIAAVTEIGLDTEGRAYYRRKRADGKNSLEAIRCLKRRISDVVYRLLVADAQLALVRGGSAAL